MLSRRCLMWEEVTVWQLFTDCVSTSSAGITTTSSRPSSPATALGKQAMSWHFCQVNGRLLVL